MKHVARRTFALLSVGVLTLSACSDSSTGPKATVTMTAQEALAVASGIMVEVSNALGRTAGFDVAPLGASAAVMPSQPFDVTCTNGGKISGNITYAFNVSDAGTGQITGSMTVTPQSCMVSNGTKLIPVSGQWTVDFTMNFNQFLAGDFIWHAFGALAWEGGSCSLDYTMKLSPDGHGRVTGTFCGVTLDSTI